MITSLSGSLEELRTVHVEHACASQSAHLRLVGPTCRSGVSLDSMSRPRFSQLDPLSSSVKGERLQKCTDPGPRQLMALSSHALALADALTPDPYGRPSLPAASVQVANLLVTMAAIEKVDARVIIPWHDSGMCGIPEESDRASATAAVLTGSVRLQYAWAALEQLLAELPKIGSQARMRTEERVVRRTSEGQSLEHADCTARRLVRATATLFARQQLPAPDLADLGDLDAFSSGAALRCARLVRNKIIHGNIAEVATSDFGGDGFLQAAVSEEASRAALFAIQYLALASGAHVPCKLAVAGMFVLRDKRASPDGRSCHALELDDEEGWNDVTYLDGVMVRADNYLRVAHLEPRR